MFCSPHFIGSVSDIDTIYNGLRKHIGLLRKQDGGLNIKGDGQYYSQYDNMWSMLVCKGYQGLLEVLRDIHQKNGPQRHFISIG